MKTKFPYWFEQELVEKSGITKEGFHKVHGARWRQIYQAVTEAFADKTKTWKNGLHWANISGYSPKSMKKLRGCYAVDYKTWFRKLPEILPASDRDVYFLLDWNGGDWYFGECFLLFESGVPELIKALSVLAESAFLGMGSLDYYIVSKKYRWLIGFNHHDIASFVGDGLDPSCLES